MSSAAPGARATSSRFLRLSAGLVGDAVLLASTALAVAAVGRTEGGFEVEVWAPFGVLLVLAVGAMLAVGRRPTRLTAAAAGALVALGLWSVASTAWGGLPDEAWRLLDQSVLAAAAFLVGSMLAPGRGSRLVLAGALAGLTGQAIELVIRPALGSRPESWFAGRTLDGPVGYHNGQAGLLVIGIPLALWVIGDRRRLARAAGGGAATMLVAALLLTQSRAGIGVAAVALALQLLIARDGALVLRTVPLALVGVALTRPLSDVDAALLSERGIAAALRTYALWALAGAAVVAATSLSAYSSQRLRRGLVLGIATIVLVGSTVAVVSELRESRPFGDALSSFDDSNPGWAPPGETRLASVSLNGRRDSWRVTLIMAADDPILGAGQGEFARAWTEERRLDELFLLQPHSLALELLSELGAVGLGLFAAFVVLAFAAAARGPSRPLSAAAVAVLAAVLLQAAVDWTWWFTGLTGTALLVAGAAAGGARGRVPGAVATSVGALIVLAIGLLFAGPYVGQRHITRATDLWQSDPSAAQLAVDAALRWNRWSPQAVALNGRLAEQRGDYRIAAMEYARAADFSQAPWLNHLREARAYAAADDGPGWIAACRRAAAENPSETTLRYGIC